MLLYENAFQSKYEEIKTWFPVWYPELLEMDSIWRVVGSQLDTVQEGIIRAIDNNFLEFMDEVTLSKMEIFLDITYDGPRTLDDRKRAVAACFLGGTHIGRKEIKDLIEVFTDGASTEIEFDHDPIEKKSILLIFVDRGSVLQLRYGDIYEALSRKIPAHLGFGLMVRYEFSVVVSYDRAKYIFGYELAGTKPEIATLGNINELDSVVRTLHNVVSFNYIQSNSDGSPISGTHPETVTVGKLNQLGTGVEGLRGDTIFNLIQTGIDEKVLVGLNPDTSTLGKHGIAQAVTQLEQSSKIYDFDLTGRSPYNTTIGAVDSIDFCVETGYDSTTFDHVPTGKEPTDAIIGDFNENKVGFPDVLVEGIGFSYIPCGTVFSKLS